MSDASRKEEEQPSSSVFLSMYKQGFITRTEDLRAEIYGVIEKNPGIRYKELTRLVGISNGVLTYHLGVLERAREIKVKRQSNNRVTRYFVAYMPKEDSDILGFLRSAVTRNIALFVLKNEYCTFTEIVDHVRKAPSTVSWYIKRLKEAGILHVIYRDEHQLFSLTDKTMVSSILLKYKQSFTDKIIDNYTEMIDRL
ncbi:MAG: winged helix-turn-helix transcriptional regulator, partial [Nitrososphaeraceae archaeon]